MDGKSLDVAQEKISRLRDIFPEAVTDGKLDSDRLRQALGENLAVGKERYGLSWPGKSEVFRTIQEPTTATLVPAREESIDFDATENIFIEGENLETLKVLQKAYFGKVKVIVIDGPYNTGNDTFVYPDNFAERKDAYLRRINEVDDQGYLNKEDLFRKNARESGHFHSNWLGMMYPRLYLARNLLQEDGVIFVHIDDHEVHNLRHLMDEIFGEETFVAQLTWKSRMYPDSRAKTGVSTDHEYILIYNRSELGKLRGLERDETKFSNPDNDARGPWMSRSLLGLANKQQRPNLHYSIQDPETGRIFQPPPDTGWRYSKDRMQQLIDKKCILFPSNIDGRPREKKFRADMQSELIPFPTVIADTFTSDGTADIRSIFGLELFDFSKPVPLIKKLLVQGTESDSLILDFFGGACSTAHAVLDLNREDGGNRRFIMIQLPEKTDENSEAFKTGYRTIADIGKERIRRVIAKMKKDREEKLPLTEKPDLGFKVFKLRPSNFRVWRSDIRTPEQLTTQLEMSLDNIKPHAEKENQLWEILLKAGYPLSAKVEEKELGGHPVHVLEEGKLAIALNGVSAETIAAVVRMKPLAFICPDSLFGGNDPLKTNTALQLRDAGIDFKSL